MGQEQAKGLSDKEEESISFGFMLDLLDAHLDPQEQQSMNDASQVISKWIKNRMLKRAIEARKAVDQPLDSATAQRRNSSFKEWTTPMKPTVQLEQPLEFQQQEKQMQEHHSMQKLKRKPEEEEQEQQMQVINLELEHHSMQKLRRKHVKRRNTYITIGQKIEDVDHFEMREETNATTDLQQHHMNINSPTPTPAAATAPKLVFNRTSEMNSSDTISPKEQQVVQEHPNKLLSPLGRSLPSSSVHTYSSLVPPLLIPIEQQQGRETEIEHSYDDSFRERSIDSLSSNAGQQQQQEEQQQQQEQQEQEEQEHQGQQEARRWLPHPCDRPQSSRRSGRRRPRWCRSR